MRSAKCTFQEASVDHVVHLLGDSVFDNTPYVARGESVIEQLIDHLPAGWSAGLTAKDGATCSSV